MKVMMPFYSQKNPDQGCQKLVTQSVNLWKQVWPIQQLI